MSAKQLKLAIADAQSDNPHTVTLPNACPGSIIQLDDDAAYRAFSVSMHTPNTLPPDQWNMIKLPSEMPTAENADIEVNSEFIMVDKITCGLLDGHELTTVFGEQGRLTGITMHPPSETENVDDYWALKADTFKKTLTLEDGTAEGQSNLG